MREAETEKEVVDWCLQRGGECLKLKIDGDRGFPDRTILMPGAIIAFVELKTRTGRTKWRQDFWVNRLRSLGFHVEVCRSLVEVQNLVRRVEKCKTR